MAGGVEPLLVFWRAWGIQTLVMLSFTMQVTLLVLADLRRRKDSVVLNVVGWSAYLLADTTAVYALGHFAVTSQSAEHELMALWAPLLLVHLGGPGNITAYAVEDNRLWLRYLQSLGVQILATAYVLYEYSNFRHPSSLGGATIIMFVVGVLKYGERVWALKSAGGVPTSQVMQLPAVTLYGKVVEKMYQAVQVHMSRTYDVFYSKAVVMYTWYGACIRVISPVATVATFLMFHRVSHNANYRRADVIVTYIMLVGAVVLEMNSVLRGIFSNSTSMLLLEWRWGKWIGFVIVLLLHLAYLVTRKAGICTVYWSSSMRQLDLFDLCTRTRASLGSKMARWMGWEDWWNPLVYSWSIPISAATIELLKKELFLWFIHIWDDGYEIMHLKRIRSEFKQLPDEILVWHIATHVYLSWHEDEAAKGNPRALRPEFGKVIKAFSNYMFFLLATHPDLLPGDPASHIKVRNYVILNFKYGSTKDLARLIQEYDDQELSLHVGAKKILVHGARLSADLIAEAKSNDYVSETDPISVVWLDLLGQAASRCGDDFHVKRLSNGGEFITVFSLLMALVQCIIEDSKGPGVRLGSRPGFLPRHDV